MELFEKVLKKLEVLGTTSKEVAEALVQKGIKGERWMRKTCATANFITKEFPELDWLSVSGRRVSGYDAGNDIEFTVIPPEPVADFINDFDNGLFPDLVS